MQYVFDYPNTRALDNKRLYNEINSSLKIDNFSKNINQCNVIVNIYKKVNKVNGKVFSRYYYTYDELKFIINKITKLNILNWEFVEHSTINSPKVQLEIVTIGDLKCQHLMLKKKLKNITLQMKSLNQSGKKQKKPLNVVI